MKVYQFKVRDFATVLVGQKMKDGPEYPHNYFYVQRGDGKEYAYEFERIEWVKLIYEDNE